MANFVPSLAVKEYENRSMFREVIDMSRVSCFLTHGLWFYKCYFQFLSPCVVVEVVVGENSVQTWDRMAVLAN